MVRFLVVALVGLAFASPAFSNVPDPDFSIVPNIVYTGDATYPYTVTINSSTQPLEDVMVTIIFSPAADGLACWCSGQTHPSISAITDEFGEATFFIGGGGCLDPTRLGGLVAEVFADGFKMAEPGAVSPDAVDDSGLLPTSGWNPGGTCSSGLTDAVFHTPPLSTGIYEFCSDINSDGSVLLQDAVLMTPYLALGTSCAE
jgi:hypothetical protein